MNFQNWERVGVGAGAGVMRVRAMRNRRVGASGSDENKFSQGAGASESDEVGVMKTLVRSISPRIHPGHGKSSTVFLM